MQFFPIKEEEMDKEQALLLSTGFYTNLKDIYHEITTK